MDLLETWAEWKPGCAPFVLAGDKEVLASENSQNAIVAHRSWDEVVGDSDFCKPDDKKLHLGLLPQPFCGELGIPFTLADVSAILAA